MQILSSRPAQTFLVLIIISSCTRGKSQQCIHSPRYTKPYIIGSNLGRCLFLKVYFDPNAVYQTNHAGNVLLVLNPNNIRNRVCGVDLDRTLNVVTEVNCGFPITGRYPIRGSAETTVNQLRDINGNRIEFISTPVLKKSTVEFALPYIYEVDIVPQDACSLRERTTVGGLPVCIVKPRLCGKVDEDTARMCSISQKESETLNFNKLFSPFGYKAALPYPYDMATQNFDTGCKFKVCAPVRCVNGLCRAQECRMRRTTCVTEAKQFVYKERCFV